ncbi:MAG: hypothetical protein BM485_02195 [Desulfobulbaceae bacterium DB1]|nr:MAG: hypothetical protein BM485_02195 [Desulfobulbaceae bacterium DB1]
MFHLRFEGFLQKLRERWIKLFSLKTAVFKFFFNSTSLGRAYSAMGMPSVDFCCFFSDIIA